MYEANYALDIDDEMSGISLKGEEKDNFEQAVDRPWSDSAKIPYSVRQNS